MVGTVGIAVGANGAHAAVARRLEIAGTVIDDQSDCYVIAEIGHNHQGKFDTAREMFRVAKECGADAVKLQKRHNRTLYTAQAYDRPYNGENSFGATYGEHREFLEFGAYEYGELKRYADDLGIHFFATAFDLRSADFLADLDMPAYKIASGDIRSLPLLEHVARFQRPMIISTGAARMADVERAYEVVTAINRRVCILQCTATYPVEFQEMDLSVISTYRERFPDTVIGLSSHDNGIAMAAAAYVLGSRVVEKHFTLNRASRGTDHAFSLEPVGLRKLVRDLRRVRVALGDGTKKVYPSEYGARSKMGKALVAARDLPAGHVLTNQDLVMKSPGEGISPADLDSVLGRALARPLQTDEALVAEALR